MAYAEGTLFLKLDAVKAGFTDSSAASACLSGDPATSDLSALPEWSLTL